LKRRALIAVGILAAWMAGLGMLVRREYFRPHIERLAEAALRVTPGAVFYAVMQGDKQIGFASSTIDTVPNAIEQREYMVVDVPVGGTTQRASARTNIVLTRTLRVKTFEVELETAQNPTRISGEVVGDSVLRIAVQPEPDARPDSQVLRIAGPILLPTLVPLAVALEEKPKVGKSYVLPVFDPSTLASRDVRMDVEAESLFVVNDSSVFDSTSGRWNPVLPDTVRAWQIVAQSGAGVGGWVDEQGRLIASSQMGFHLRRMPYEVAFENWRRDSDSAAATRATPTRSRPRPDDILERTAIAANKRLRGTTRELRVRLSGAALTGFDLQGGRQILTGDTLVISREDVGALIPRYIAIDADRRARYPDLKAEPFLEVGHPEIVAAAERITGGSRDPRLIVQRINQWVHDSVKKQITVGIPSALHVLHTRTGDCNEHTQLFTALARAAGVPTRIAAGLAYVDGKFYYHAWPEVLLRGWVAVDPTFGQFPADASHLRFVNGGLANQAELLRLMGNLKIDVLSTR